MVSMWEHAFCLAVAVMSSAHDHAHAHQLPNWTATWNMKQSTVIMPCNHTGFLDPEVYKDWGLVDLDWSNARSIWSTATPMTCQETLIEQAATVKRVNPTAKVFVYRNLVKALPWYSDVRTKMLDPAYAGWFLRYRDGADGGPYHTPPCTGVKCSDFYHDQEQTPQRPSPSPDDTPSSNTCLTGECDCGAGLPCGEYLFDHRNASLRSWLLEDFVLGPAAGLGNPNVDGFYFDDSWHTAPRAPSKPGTGQCSTSARGGASEMDPWCTVDMGLSQRDVADITSNWTATGERAEAAVLVHGGFTWGANSMFVGTGTRVQSQTPGSPPRGVVPQNATECLAFLREACAPTSKWSAGALLFELTRKTFHDPFPLPYVAQDVAQFLLTRGPYAWLGHNWMRCLTDAATPFLRPAELDVDYGVPLEEHCVETAPGSGKFARAWSNADVELDCNSWTATLEPRLGSETLEIQ